MANTTWNPSDKVANISLTGSNLIATTTSTAQGGLRAVDSLSAGKCYWEVTLGVVATGSSGLGLSKAGISLTARFYVNNASGVGLAGVSTARVLVVDGVNVGPSLTGTWTAGVVVCTAVDLTSQLLWMRLGAAGLWNGVAGNNPATGVGGVSIAGFGGGTAVFPHGFMLGVSGSQYTANFGDSAFVGAVPSGFYAGFPTGGVIPSSGAAQAMAMVLA